MICSLRVGEKAGGPLHALLLDAVYPRPRTGRHPSSDFRTRSFALETPGPRNGASPPLHGSFTPIAHHPGGQHRQRHTALTVEAFRLMSATTTSYAIGRSVP